MNIAIIGLGLIGGSLAKSIKEHSDHTVWGYDIDPVTTSKAAACGAIDDELNMADLGKCKMVLVALYPEKCVNFIKEHADDFAEGAMVIDCAGVKRAVVGPLEEIVRDRKWLYVGGHPMAGREYSGFYYAIGDLFEKASMILTPPRDIDIADLDFLKNFFLSIGFGRVRITTPAEHDSMIAYTSQLAHIVSGAYVKNPRSADHKGFSAGSFLDMTRVARLNENMWSELCMDNADLLVPSIDDLIMRLSQYREALAGGDEEKLMELLKEGRLMKEALD